MACCGHALREEGSNSCPSLKLVTCFTKVKQFCLPDCYTPLHVFIYLFIFPPEKGKIVGQSGLREGLLRIQTSYQYAVDH